MFRQELYHFRKGVELANTRRLNGQNWTSWKYFFRWVSDQKQGRNPVSEAFPWMNYFVIDFLQKNMNASDKVFEYGGGGSTMFFLRRIGVEEIVTAEHDTEWFGRLEQKINSLGYKNWTGLQFPAEQGSLGSDASDPSHYHSMDPAFKEMNFKKYASAIDTYPDFYFNLVIVDGRARPSCLIHAMPKIKSGGLLLLDNCERAYYLEKTQAVIESSFIPEFVKTGPCPYTREFTSTMIWRKMNEG